MPVWLKKLLIYTVALAAIFASSLFAERLDIDSAIYLVVSLCVFLFETLIIVYASTGKSLCCVWSVRKYGVPMAAAFLGFTLLFFFGSATFTLYLRTACLATQLVLLGVQTVDMVRGFSK